MSELLNVPDYLLTPLSQQVTLHLPATGPLDEPTTLLLRDRLSEVYPKGSMTFFGRVADPATMTPDRLYVLRLRNGSYLMQPFVSLTGGYIVVGAWSGEATPAPVALAEIADLYVAQMRQGYDAATEQWQRINL